jgi:hypothetical protein
MVFLSTGRLESWAGKEAVKLKWSSKIERMAAGANASEAGPSLSPVRAYGRDTAIVDPVELLEDQAGEQYVGRVG